MGYRHECLFARPGHPLSRADASVPGYVMHVYSDGSREHVLSYEGWVSRKPREFGQTIAVEQCSTPNCIFNLERAERLREHGHDIADPVTRSQRDTTDRSAMPRDEP